MKKIFLGFIVFIIFATIVCVVKMCMPNILNFIATKKIENKDYKTAAKLLMINVRSNPNDKDSATLCFKALQHLPMNYYVQEDLYFLSKHHEAGGASYDAKKLLNEFKRKIIDKVGDNYIDKAPEADGLIRWDILKFPLKVYVSGAFNTSQQNSIKKAFFHWHERVKFFTYNFVSDEKNADIVVLPNSKGSGNCQQGQACRYVAGYTIPEISSNQLLKMKIFIALKSASGRDITAGNIYKTSLHEIGHAMGIQGHSDMKGDLMYMSPQHSEENYSVSDILDRDLNTIKLLYILSPDITNTSPKKFRKDKLIYSPIILGDKSDIQDKKIEELEAYVKKAPDMSIGWSNLATAYAEKEDYEKSVKYLEKALSLAYTNEEKFVIYSNIGISYMNMSEFYKAEDAFNKAAAINNSLRIKFLFALNNYMKGDKDKALSMLEPLFNENPSDIDIALLLANIYREKLNINAAKQVMEKLKQNNPQAANNEAVKNF